LFLDAALAQSLAHQVGKILHEETGADPQIDAFERLANNYRSII
jgi:glycerol-3-phosphate dehydrogenase